MLYLSFWFWPCTFLRIFRMGENLFVWSLLDLNKKSNKFQKSLSSSNTFLIFFGIAHSIHVYFHFLLNHQFIFGIWSMVHWSDFNQPKSKGQIWCILVFHRILFFSFLVVCNVLLSSWSWMLKAFLYLYYYAMLGSKHWQKNFCHTQHLADSGC